MSDDVITLQDRMDAVGWSEDKGDDYRHLVFLWMRDATSEIKRLQAEVKSLERVLNSRTEHLV